ncbi:TonB-dependent receptor [Undibacterium sp. TJN25]|uniref:TonB-dependent receptor n=1 Tax=Undibacterium sp. TJN25 TaxID=3413056 RepID=UPI003BF13A8A
MKLKKIAQCIALIGVSSTVFAQEQADQQGEPQKVEITGSSIKRIAKEGALPVQVITKSDIERQGITSAEQLMRIISANGTGTNNMTSGNNVFGADADRLVGGASFANLRGLGPSSTLVLLNGRRVSAHGTSGKSVDLNAIPMAAVERIEILKDGASAIYGTDAIGGVINFILKTNYTGVEIAADTNITQEGGGATRRASLLAGKGTLDKDGYNVMASLTLDKADILRSSQRDFARGYQPARGLSPDTTGTPYANQLSGAGTALGTGFKLPGDPNSYLQASLLSLTGKCGTIPGMSQYDAPLWQNSTSILRSTYSCAYDYGADYVMQQPVEHANLVSRGTIQINADTKAFAELTASRAKSRAEFTPLQISTSIASKNVYPVGGPYYQDLSAYIPTFDNTKPIAYKWRANDLGNRTQETTSDNARLLLGMEGVVLGKWDYKLGVSAARSKADTQLVDGYSYTDKLYAALATGIINPWLAPGQKQTPEAMALLNSTKAYVDLQGGTTKLTQADGNISGELFQLPAGPLSIAAGFDLRRESYEFSQGIDATTILLAPGNAALPSVSRDIKAVYAETIIPITKSLELQAAVRHDQYSVIGGTTNPKLAFRYQPLEAIVFRGSVNSGFLAPSFQQLYSGQLTQELPNGADDPVQCPLHPGDPNYCSIKMDYRTGGNSALKPETSKQGSIGFVVSPMKGLTGSLDIWEIRSKNRILNRTVTQVLANYQSLLNNIVRNPDGTIDYIQAGWINAAGSQTRGADVSLHYDTESLPSGKWSFAIDGTYTNSFKYHEFEDQPYQELVGNFGTSDLYLRWKHNASITWTRGSWSVMGTQLYASGYKDQLPKGVIPPGFNPYVDAYITYGLSATYTGFKNTTITAGIQNLFNTDPPFTAHNVDDVVGAGWDPRVADPRGRAFTLNVNYKFN